ncbi:hypothetical protein [Cryobacterium adonitolivorans]|uniref:hypothetical protein n=1 Tax=Cryobacterium adonitolivorans TaxID=1259189 RepID=UPI0030B9C1AC
MERSELLDLRHQVRNRMWCRSGGLLRGDGLLGTHVYLFLLVLFLIGCRLNPTGNR